MPKPKGFVVYEGPSSFDGSPIVVLITLDSSNRKTGPMSQMWILRRDVRPTEAVASGLDAAICGECPLMGRMEYGKRIERVCYVNVGQAPNGVYDAYKSGAYAPVADLQPEHLGVGLRHGAYGDPALVPLDMLRMLSLAAPMWTGYTHMWRTIDPAYARMLMASCETEQDLAYAREMGYRAFVVSEEQPPGTVECAATRERNPLQCVDCGMCAGTRFGAVKGAVDVWIAPHGSGKKYLPLVTI